MGRSEQTKNSLGGIDIYDLDSLFLWMKLGRATLIYKQTKLCNVKHKVVT